MAKISQNWLSHTFFRYNRPQSRASKPSSHPYYFKYDLKYITEYPTGKKNGFQKVLDTNLGQNPPIFEFSSLRPRQI